MILAYILLFTFIGSILSLVGSLFLLVKRKIPEDISGHLVSFAAGVILAFVFFDLLPEAAEGANGINYLGSALVGFVIFFFAERFIHVFHLHHGHVEKAPTSLVLIGDSLHNFIDGVAITASFLTSIPLGITTSLAVAAHEIPQEIADMGVLLANGLSRRKALAYNFLSAIMAILGALLAYFFAALIEKNISLFLSLTAGFFLYISATDLIPNLHERYQKNKNNLSTFIFLAGILVVFVFGKIFK